ncbi:unnamed protein product [Durusdinium trenchii]|uniref:Uncharacterized protein n=1 Tax=Durusdinium trenchii TaxID=1381693 RepID=A0ABP0MNN9_9DINO
MLQDCSMNYVWLRPLVEQFPKCAPSQFFIVDCLLVVDELLNDNLLMRAPENGRIVPTSRAEKVDLATAEAVRIRKCYSTLRYLYRNGATAGESRVARKQRRQEREREQESQVEEDQAGANSPTSSGADHDLAAPDEFERPASPARDECGGDDEAASDPSSSDCEPCEKPCKNQKGPVGSDAAGDSDSDDVSSEATLGLDLRPLRSALTRKRSCEDVVAESQMSDSDSEKAKASASKKKAKEANKSKKASFKRGVKKTVAKQREGSSLRVEKVPKVMRVDSYGAYSLAEIPAEARPDLTKKNRGEHSYTVTTSVTTPAGEEEEVVVDALLRNRAYYIKCRGCEGAIGPLSARMPRSWLNHHSWLAPVCEDIMGKGNALIRARKGIAQLPDMEKHLNAGNTFRDKQKRSILAGLRVLKVIGVLVSLLFAQKNLPFTPLDHFEAFAGTRSEARHAVALDIKYDSEGMNILTTEGFIQHL